MSMHVFSQQLSNSGFETWSGTYNPDNWATLESAFLANFGLVTKDTTDKTEGTASASIKTDSVSISGGKTLAAGFVFYGFAKYSSTNHTLSLNPKPFTYRPDTLSFFYKYHAPLEQSSIRRFG